MKAPSPSGAEGQDSRSTALMLAAEGFKIVPLPPREKFPRGLSEWQKRATNDVAQIEEWFAKHPDRGVGWAMGTQPNGLNLAGIDVDVAGGKLGFSTMAELRDRFGLREMMRNTTRTETGTGGWHLIVDTGPVVCTNGKLGPGVDLRGEGGFLVAPPSIHPNGERYKWSKAPWDVPPFRVWESFANWMNHPEAEEGGRSLSARPRPVGVASSLSEATPADWARANLRIPDLLVEGGWQYRETKGMDTFWTRPDKSLRDGHSAVLHDDAPLVVWSTSAPAPFWRAGRSNPDGSRSLSPIEVFAAVRCNGDVRSASAEIRKLMPRQEPVLVAPPVAVEAQPAELTLPPVARDLNLPAEFWEARPWLTHIRDAAWSRMVSPDATLLGFLTRYATLIPPTVQIEAMIGDTATFDFFSCVVASSSGGKSIANRVSRSLIPVERTDIDLDVPLGSGEGVAQMFFGPGTDPETGKKTAEQVIVKQAMHFTVDEGTSIIQQQSRQGTTIVQALCSAWTGDPIGQANAKLENRRIIAAKRVRVTVTINIQTAKGHQLMDESLIGLPQRMVFAYAHSPLPEDLPEWPGVLQPPLPPVISSGPTIVRYAPEIVQEVRDLRRAVGTEKIRLGELDGHLQLQRIKIAGLMALIEGRLLVEADDWALAGSVVDSSVAVRQLLIDTKIEADRVRNTTQGVAQASRELAADDFKERQKIARLRDSIIAKVPDEGVGRNALRKAVCSSDTKHRFDAALEAAVQDGKVQVSADGLVQRTT